MHPLVASIKDAASGPVLGCPWTGNKAVNYMFLFDMSVGIYDNHNVIKQHYTTYSLEVGHGDGASQSSATTLRNGCVVALSNSWFQGAGARPPLFLER
jgi:hypothetical protein